MNYSKILIILKNFYSLINIKYFSSICSYQWRIQEFLKGGAVKQKGGAVMIKVQYFGEKSLESSMKSVSKEGAVAPTSSAVDPPLS